jgi:hypothetical protein
MAWIESHQALGHHPKTLQLAAELGVSLPTAVGHLHFLWWWALEYAPDGRLKPGSEQTIARACEWRGQARRFWSGLLAAGFIEVADGGAKIHDWADYAGRLLEKRRRDAARKRQVRSDPSQLASNGHPPDVGAPAQVPYLTVPDLNRTGPDPTPPTPPSDRPKEGTGPLIGAPTHEIERCPVCSRPSNLGRHEEHVRSHQEEPSRP